MGKTKYKYYRLNRIDKQDCQYNVIFGERSSGKTYAVKERILKNYFKTGEQGAIIRRWDDDLRGVRGAVMFDDQTDLVKKLSGGKYTGVLYQSRRWYFSKYNMDTGKTEKSEEPFCYAFGLNVMEHDKSTSYPKITTVLFDEVLTRGHYLNDEFVLFMNVISTIARLRKNIKIYMLGNTVNKYCPYFAEMGLTNAKNMKQGDLDVYTYGDSGLRVAVEYTGSNSEAKESNVLFAFDNPKLHMISHGNWEIDIYPHLPIYYRPQDILFMFFVEFDGEIVQGDVIGSGFEKYGNNQKREVPTHPFIYYHGKTTEIKHPQTDYIFSTQVSNLPNWHRHILKPTDKPGERIRQLMIQEYAFYQTNEIGEIVNNYIKWSKGVMLD